MTTKRNAIDELTELNIQINDALRPLNTHTNRLLLFQARWRAMDWNTFSKAHYTKLWEMVEECCEILISHGEDMTKVGDLLVKHTEVERRILDKIPAEMWEAE